jgi:methylated-DNA-[protein]-cysteine S-methyltransferase
MAIAFCLFDTAIGTGGIAWGDQGVVGIQLPEPDPAALRARIRRRFSSALETEPPPAIGRAMRGMTELLNGGTADLSDVVLDFDGVPEFDRQVYAVARTVPAGETTSYGEIATRLGDVHLARDVGQALAHNPFPIVVPCHRVLAAGGKLGGFSARGGVRTKQQLLEIERASVSWQLPLV